MLHDRHRRDSARISAARPSPARSSSPGPRTHRRETHTQLGLTARIQHDMGGDIYGDWMRVQALLPGTPAWHVTPLTASLGASATAQTIPALPALKPA